MRIISGFQTGADQGGVQAARRLGYETGGMMPKGWATEYGPRPEFAALYHAVESTSKDYVSRTIWNLMSSDGTVVFTHGPLDGGSLRTYDECERRHKPVCLIDFRELDDGVSGVAVKVWIQHHRIATLNVSGNRESKSPGITIRVENFLCRALPDRRALPQ